MAKFLIRRVPTGHKFDLHAANGEVIVSSEVYTSAAACLRGIAGVVKYAGAPLADLTEDGGGKIPNPRFELYRDRAGRYRFRLRSRNGKIIAVSQSYHGKPACLGGIDSVRKNAAEAEIEE